MYSLKRDESERIQIVKVICTILVIFIHMSNENLALKDGVVVNEIPYWLQSFKYIVSECIGRVAVPFFFLFSSILLYSKKFDYWKNIKKKFKTLCIPYVLCISCYILLFFVAQSIPFLEPYFSNQDNVIRSWNISQWIQAYLGRGANQPFCVPLWFIQDLILLNIIGSILEKIVYRVPKLMLFVIVIVWIGNINIPLLDVQAFVFWILGILVVKYNVSMEMADRIPWGIFIVLPIGLFLDASYRINGFHQALILIDMLFVLKLSKLVDESKGKPCFIRLMKYSLFVYMFHLLPLTTIKKVALRFVTQTPIIQLAEFCLIPFLTLAICICVAKVIIVICPKFYNLLVGGRN